MKRILLIGSIVAVVLIIVGGAGIVFAQVRGIDNGNVTAIVNPLNERGIVRQYGYGPGGMMGGYGPGGMMGGYNQGYGPGYGPGGMMGGNNQGYGPGYGPGGMMGGNGSGYGPGGMMGNGGLALGKGIMREYMVSAFAEAVGLTPDEVLTRLQNGESMREIALAQGKTEAELPDLIAQVQQAAVDKAVEDGAITQAQSEVILERMRNYQGPGFGPGYGMEGCPMWGGQPYP